MKKARMNPSLTRFMAKPMPHTYKCSVCDELSRSGRRRQVQGDTAFICAKCLKKALFRARERTSLRDAERIISERESHV